MFSRFASIISVLVLVLFITLAATQGPRISLKCSSTQMKILIPKQMFPGFSREDLHLRNSSCGAIESSTHFILVTKLTECGTVAKQTGNIIRYSNVVLDRVFQSPFITRSNQLRIPFRCGFFRKEKVSVKRKEKILPRILGNGYLGLALELFSGKNYQSSYKSYDFPVSVSINNELYFGLKLDAIDRQLSIKAKHCYATPEQPTDSKIKYDFIKNGCAVDDTVTFYKTQSPREQRFSLKAFKFTGIYPSVFFHCQVTVCNSSDSNSECSTLCNEPHNRDRIKRSPGDLSYPLVKGPIVFTDMNRLTFKQVEITTRISRKTEAHNTYILHLVAVVFVTIVTLLLVFLVHWVRRMKDKAMVEKAANQVLTVPPAV